MFMKNLYAAKVHCKVGGSEMEWALRTAPINGCEKDKRWFIN